MMNNKGSIDVAVILVMLALMTVVYVNFRKGQEKLAMPTACETRVAAAKYGDIIEVYQGWYRDAEVKLTDYFAEEKGYRVVLDGDVKFIHITDLFKECAK